MPYVPVQVPCVAVSVPLYVAEDVVVVGAPKKDGYEGDGYIVVRHRSTEVVKEMVKTILATVKVHYSP